MAVPKPPQLRYPIRKIDSFDDYLEIKVIQYAPPKFDTNKNDLTVSTSNESLAGNLKKPLITIQLPIPQGINDTSSVSWGENSLNTAAALGANIAESTLKGGNLIDSGGQALQDLATALTSSATSGVAQQVVLSKITSNLVNSIGGNTATTPEGLLTRATGKVLNPHMELLFNNVTLRSFSFQFDLAPRDSKEALVVKQIIRTFKKHMAAKSGKGGVGEGAGGVFISSPEVFQLTYKTGARKHRFLNSFKPMALQNTTVNYTGSGTYATYEDSTPVHMQLTLTFQELNPIYFEDYDDEKDTGVGY
jgi:hypothetical protein